MSYSMNRDGWGEEDGVLVHLESEMGVRLDPDHGDWVIADLEDEIVGEPFQTPQAAMDAVDASFAANPRHAHEWSA